MPFERVNCVSRAVPLLWNVPSAVDGAVKVTEAPPNGDPLEVTNTENLPNAYPPTDCGVVYPPDCAAIAIVGGWEAEEPPPPQPARKIAAVMARIEAMETAILELIFRFMELLLL